ncbi:MAG: hypothetical protein RIC18_00145 [Hoeflea sp.]|uniref:hypothetical protein n=1 Tax=Hoeflea sp. TaxID=1940281 RepID=UPI0032EF1737
MVVEVRNGSGSIRMLGAACFATGLGFAAPALAEAECADEVRALMQGTGPHQGPVRSRSLTRMTGGMEMVSLGLTEGKNHLTMDADGNPVSLFRDAKFYTTSDAGETWTLVQTYSAETMEQTRQGLAKQAAQARNITCEYGLDLDGNRVNYYTVDYEMHGTGTPMQGKYWVDAETGFALKAITTSDPGGNETVIEQVNEPAPGETIPSPDE